MTATRMGRQARRRRRRRRRRRTTSLPPCVLLGCDPATTLKELKHVVITDFTDADAAKPYLALASTSQTARNVLLGALVRSSLESNPAGAHGHTEGVKTRDILDVDAAARNAAPVAGYESE